MGMGNRIRSLREQLGLSQEHLAEILGVSFQAVSSWERASACRTQTGCRTLPGL